MENLQVELSHQNDAALVASILTDAIKVKIEHGDNAWGSEGWSQEEVIDCMHESSVYLIYDNDEPVATVSLQDTDEKSWGHHEPDALYLHRLAVKEGMNGRGLGQKIMNWALHEAAAQGKNYLRLDCPADNAELCAYYETQGFQKVGENKDSGYEGYVAALYERAAK